MIIETVYNGRDNTNDLQLSSDGVAADLSVATRFLLAIEYEGGGTAVIDSDITPSAFYSSAGGGVLKLKLGASGLTAGRMQARLTVFDAVNANGIAWGNKFTIIAID